ncbi:hypothetical protein Q1W73_16265 [Asticcacaulis sp. ZE23SCel15]|uniref:hypothetical protein n=1 Tax=Asticcacaulis sp. ZE23SCel15 TaxID=3059027 RepID=UPI00265F0DDB|nr:hypothetical protein [Asticcacaulis sp. ZE23SCel15]WKL57197.1 hypothetical protein Q1W73_16265 [Asticcacaulis sp. ZE23SCel15]
MGRDKRHIKSWITGFAPLFVGVSAIACMPCENALSLPDTIKKAEVIVIGERKTGEMKAFAGGPAGKNDYVTLSVSKVLKGTDVPARISVRTWYGMCPYGIDLDKNKKAIVYLRKVDSHYEVVGDGCAEKFTPMRGQKVMVNEEGVALADFLKLYGL